MNKKFLLHTCCAPCSVAVIEELKVQYALTVFFYNPNIYPREEYLKRKSEVIRICREWGVAMIDADYAPEEWNKKIVGLEKEPEGGARCSVCFNLRLEKAADYARKNGFDLFGTTLTSGRQKNSAVINAIGIEIGDRVGIKFYDEDWKKGGRQERKNLLVKKYGVYQQRYCGCVYSRSRIT